MQHQAPRDRPPRAGSVPFGGLCLLTTPMPQGLPTAPANVKLASWSGSLRVSHPVSGALRHSYVCSFVGRVTLNKTDLLKVALPVLKHAPNAFLQSIPAQGGPVQAEVRRLHIPAPLYIQADPSGGQGVSQPKSRC